MKTYRQYLTEVCDAYGKQSNTKKQRNIAAAEKAFTDISNTKDAKVIVFFMRPGSAYNNKNDRDSYYKKLAKKYGEQFAFAFVEAIKVPKAKQGKGIGSAIMQKLVAASKKYNVPVFLIASDHYGSDVSRLVEFYKRAGFELSNFEAPEELRVFGDSTINGPHNVVVDFGDEMMEFLP